MSSERKAELKVNILEGTPYETHKKAARILERIWKSTQIYADLLGADEVRTIRPANQGLANYYCSYG